MDTSKLNPKAIAMLEQGDAIQLPLWEGFWFLANGVIYVFTKDDLLLNTPQIDEYGNSEDWVKANLTQELLARFIKSNRVRIDNMMNMLKETQFCNRETGKSYDFLQSSFMRLGKVLQDIGAPTPYPESSNPNSPVIEKHADKADKEQMILMNSFIDLDTVAACKMLRKEVETCLDIFDWFKKVGAPGGRHLALSITYMEEARHWLGQQLNWHRIMIDRRSAAEAENEANLLREAESAYGRYGSVTDYKNFRGEPMPKFEDLSEEIKNAWKESIRTLFNQNMGRNYMGLDSPWDLYL